MSKYNIFVVYKNKEDYDRLKDTIPAGYNINYVDMNTKVGSKKGWEIKNHYAATKDPFIIVLDYKPVIGFYAEDITEHPVDQLLSFLNLKTREHN